MKTGYTVLIFPSDRRLEISIVYPIFSVVVADKPLQPIEKGLQGPGPLSFVASSKYCDHQPLHRLERILGRLGGDISRSTMCDWMAACAALVEPLYGLMKEEVLRRTGTGTYPD